VLKLAKRDLESPTLVTSYREALYTGLLAVGKYSEQVDGEISEEKRAFGSLGEIILRKLRKIGDSEEEEKILALRVMASIM
jgi:hypothetical protein